jgi:hypothetical protein
VDQETEAEAKQQGQQWPHAPAWGECTELHCTALHCTPLTKYYSCLTKCSADLVIC